MEARIENNHPPVWKPKKTQLNTVQMVFHYACVAIGTGVLSLGSSFKCGFILATIVNLFFALTSFLSLVLTTYAAVAIKAPTNPEIFAQSISKTFLVPFTIINALSPSLCVIFYLQYVQSSIQDMINTFTSNAGVWANPYMISLYVFIVIILPLLLIKNFRHLSILIALKSTFIALIGVVVIYYFVYYYLQRGFDPNHQIAYFRSGSQFTSAVLNFATAYLIQPVAAPSIDYLKSGSRRSIIKMFFWTITLVFFVYTVFGLFEYFTFFDENTGDIITSYYPDTWIRKLANILLTFIMSFSVVLVINPPRYVMIKTIAPGTQSFNKAIWISFGCIIFVAGFVLTTASGMILTIVGILLDFTAPINLYFVPSMLYLATCYKDKSIPLIIGAIFNIIVSIVLLTLLVFKYKSSF